MKSLIVPYLIVFLIISDLIMAGKINTNSKPALLFGAVYLGDDGVVLQKSKDDCGPASLKMVFNFFKIKISFEEISKALLNKNGSNMLSIKRLAEANNLKVSAYKMGVDDLKMVNGPAILHLKNKHFIVFEKIIKETIIILDPASGRLSLSLENFKTKWSGNLLIFKQ